MKKLSVFMAVLLCLSLVLTSCGGNSASSPTPTPTPTKAAESGDADNTPATQEEPAEITGEPLKFSATVVNWGADDDASQVQQEWLKVMATKMGRPIEIAYNRIPSSEYDEKVKLMFSTDDLTDFTVTPTFYDTTPSATDGMLLDLAKYDMPNYKHFIDKTPSGESLAYSVDGNIWRLLEGFLPRFPENKGMLPNAMFCWNSTVFEENGMEIPGTAEGVYEAAKKLKEIYPDVYPVNTRWGGFWSVFSMYHTSNDIYWDGSEYKFGLFDENYKKALQFLNKLYAEKLLDPEYSIETEDTVKSKWLNRQTFIGLYEWFTAPGDYTRLAKSGNGDIFAVTLYPDTELGKSWQGIQNVNTYDLSGWGQFVVSADTKEPEALATFIDLQYSPEIIELITWGIEGVTYNKSADGTNVFIDSIRLADDPFAEGDKYGMRASSKHRPGLQLASDSKAYVGMARNDYVYYDGKVHEEPIERSPYITELPYPESEYISPNFNGPKLQLSTDDSQTISEIVTPIWTYRDEMQSKFIKGEESFDNWDKFVDTINSLGDVQKVLDIHNKAAQEYLKK